MYFIDNTLRAVNEVRSSLPGSHEPLDAQAWLKFKDIAFQGGVALHTRIKFETGVYPLKLQPLSL
ncbi:hypothetical protein [Bradyrhizobium yuanmingense]|uniref:hypothetical protein n=1 Tax=Bradyrhizobium yuanmingense TaxID=108015 RepID=UPI0012FD048C|nr:hypothetical protein [Bradyrhizobium yuanmingense]